MVKGIIFSVSLNDKKSTLFSQQIFWRTKKLCMGKTWQERLNNPGFINRWLRAVQILHSYSVAFDISGKLLSAHKKLFELARNFLPG